MTVVSSAKSYTERITPPSFAYMLDTPAVLTMTIFLNFAIFSMVSFTNCARSGQLQCEIARIIFKGKRNSIITLIFPTVLAIGVIFNYKLNMTKEVASLILMITTIILTLFFILFKFARRKKHATNN